MDDIPKHLRSVYREKLLTLELKDLCINEHSGSITTMPKKAEYMTSIRHLAHHSSPVLGDQLANLTRQYQYALDGITLFLHDLAEKSCVVTVPPFEPYYTINYNTYLSKRTSQELAFMVAKIPVEDFNHSALGALENNHPCMLYDAWRATADTAAELERLMQIKQLLSESFKALIKRSVDLVSA